eukprot:scaffold22779_cov67-Phaeocystis_antarctica.AAC.5
MITGGRCIGGSGSTAADAHKQRRRLHCRRGRCAAHRYAVEEAAHGREGDLDLRLWVDVGARIVRAVVEPVGDVGARSCDERLYQQAAVGLHQLAEVEDLAEKADHQVIRTVVLRHFGGGEVTLGLVSARFRAASARLPAAVLRLDAHSTIAHLLPLPACILALASRGDR